MYLLAVALRALADAVDLQHCTRVLLEASGLRLAGPFLEGPDIGKLLVHISSGLGSYKHRPQYAALFLFVYFPSLRRHIRLLF